MSYDQSGEYTILPMEPYKIARNCSGCGGKSVYQSTGKFRVNGNGKRLDVWLIYQCIHCKHTYNLAIYSRVSKELLHLMVKSSVAPNKTNRDTIQLDFLRKACKVA